jgi:hypothetical protein
MAMVTTASGKKVFIDSVTWHYYKMEAITDDFMGNFLQMVYDIDRVLIDLEDFTVIFRDGEHYHCIEVNNLIDSVRVLEDMPQLAYVHTKLLYPLTSCYEGYELLASHACSQETIAWLTSTI